MADLLVERVELTPEEIEKYRPLVEWLHASFRAIEEAYMASVVANAARVGAWPPNAARG